MDMNKKLLLDVEENKAIGYGLISDDGTEIEIVLAGRDIVTVSENERTLKIYKLLAENCDINFCFNQSIEDFPFYPVPEFSIFAVDNKGNCFGTIGGSGDITSDDYPVGFVSSKGIYGRISDSLKDFFELAVFYPYWREIIRCEKMKIPYEIEVLETTQAKQAENDAQYNERKHEIAQTLKLSKNPKSVERLLSNIENTQEFVAYDSKNEAKMTNQFWNTRCFD